MSRGKSIIGAQKFIAYLAGHLRSLRLSRRALLSRLRISLALWAISSFVRSSTRLQNLGNSGTAGIADNEVASAAIWCARIDTERERWLLAQKSSIVARINAVLSS